MSEINRTNVKTLYEQLLLVAKKKTAEADVVLGEDGKPIEEAEAEDYGGSVLIVEILARRQMFRKRAASQAGMLNRKRMAERIQIVATNSRGLYEIAMAKRSRKSVAWKWIRRGRPSRQAHAAR